MCSHPVLRVTLLCCVSGKSICLGVLSTVFALVGCHVECVCYSPYLSQRDFDAFLPLFRAMSIHDRIHYGTMQELAVRTRDHYLGSSKVMMEELLGIRSGGEPPKRSDYEPPYSKSTSCVLLIDEVDVFFGENFYGSLLILAGIVNTPEIVEMLQFVWDNKDKRPRTKDTQLKALPCIVRLPCHEGKSTYFNPATRHNRCNGLNLKSGALLYSELPKYYSLKLGITGTLSDDRLSKFERDLAAVRFPSSSFIPSIFEKTPIVVSGVKVHDAIQDYHAEIRNDVQAQFKKGRATLVVFEDDEKLQLFEEYLASHPVADIPPTPPVLTSAVAIRCATASLRARLASTRSR